MKHKKWIFELDHQGDFDIDIPVLHTSLFGPKKCSLIESKEILQITCYFLILEWKTKFFQVSADAYVLRVNSHQTTKANMIWLILLENYFLPYYSPIR